MHVGIISDARALRCVLAPQPIISSQAPKSAMLSWQFGRPVVHLLTMVSQCDLQTNHQYRQAAHKFVASLFYPVVHRAFLRCTCFFAELVWNSSLCGTLDRVALAVSEHLGR